MLKNATRAVGLGVLFFGAGERTPAVAFEECSDLQIAYCLGYCDGREELYDGCAIGGSGGFYCLCS